MTLDFSPMTGRHVINGPVQLLITEHFDVRRPEISEHEGSGHCDESASRAIPEKARAFPPGTKTLLPTTMQRQ